MKTGPTAPADPIRDTTAIARIKTNLADSVRDTALFVLGCNTAFRASDILSLNVGDVRGRDVLSIKEQKTGKRRIVPLNQQVVQCLARLISGRSDDEPLFVGEKRGTRLTVGTLGRKWSQWCADAGLVGNYSSHTGRKTWAYQQRVRGTSVDLLQRAFGHSSGLVTMAYAGITSDEMAAIYSNEI